MSKLGKKPITIPKDAKVKLENGKLILTGPKGSRELSLNDKIFSTTISEDNNLILKLIKKNESLNIIWGTTRSIINNAVIGVTEGHEKIKNAIFEIIELSQQGIPDWNNFGLFIISLSQNSLPESFNLSAAYPNPFNPVTTLNFALPVETEVSISIYNLQGREITSLISGNMDAGYHSVIWNADAHASGVYFVKMIAGEYINTQKLMLVK